MANKRRVVIFDFDGTIADSAPMIRAIYADLAAKNNWRVLTEEDYQDLRKGSLSEARKWSGIHWWQFPIVIHSAKKLMQLEAEKVDLFPGVVKLLKELKQDGHELYVLSRNSPETIIHVLERYDLQDTLKIMRRRKRTFGSKGAAIRSLIKKNNYDKTNVWMVGDEVRDIVAGKSAGVNSIGVSWGIQDVSILERYHPTHLVYTIEELQSALQDDK